jgi:uncharacterized protein (TIGR00288 family)
VPSPENVRIAVLIDADNTSKSDAAALMEEVAKYGLPTVKRAYGDWTSNHLSGWKDQLNRHAIQPVQQFAYTTGKNSTDFALVIDAMDLLYSGNVEAYAIVSSDSDFTRLVTRLRESGRRVIGFGRRKTPESLQNACDRFVFLEVLRAGGDGTATAEHVDESGEAPAPLPDLRTILTQAIDDTSGDDGWTNLGGVGSVLGARYPSFDSRNYGFPRLSALVRGQDYLDVDQTEGGSTRVRVRPPSAKKAATKAAKKAAAKATTTPTTMPTATPSTAPSTKPTVTTRKRSAKKAQSG